MSATEPIKVYAGYMNSIKHRLNEVEKIADNKGKLSALVVQDSLALQMRFVLEAVYQSCIAAQIDHPDAIATDRVREWSPSVIRKMFKGRPAFFPAHLTEHPDKPGLLQSVAGKLVSETDAYAMHGYCGDILHHKSLYRGSPFDLQYTAEFWDRYEPFANSLIRHLATHVNFVLQPDGSSVMFLCEMHWSEKEKAPTVVRAASLGPMSFTPENGQ